MTQAVSSDRFPYLRVHLRIGSPEHIEQELDIETLVDTGFDGGVTVSPDLIDPSVAQDAQLPWLLADGSQVRAPAYLASVRIGTLPPIATLVIALGDEPLLGREVTDHLRVTFDHGHTILVEP